MKIGRMASASVSHVCRIPVSGFCVTGLYSQSKVVLLILIWLIWGPVSRMTTDFLLWKIALILLPMSNSDLSRIDRPRSRAYLPLVRQDYTSPSSPDSITGH